jgi:hypothetical protein
MLMLRTTTSVMMELVIFDKTNTHRHPPLNPTEDSPLLTCALRLGGWALMATRKSSVRAPTTVSSAVASVLSNSPGECRKLIRGGIERISGADRWKGRGSGHHTTCDDLVTALAA